MRRKILEPKQPWIMGRSRIYAAFEIAAVIGVVGACVELSVTAVDVAEIEVLPDTSSLPVGVSRRLEVRLRDAAGNELRDRAVSWSSSDPDLVSADADGRITGLAPGTATIYAMSGGTRGTARINIFPAGRLAVDPERAALSAFVGSGVPSRLTLAVSNSGSGQVSGLSTTIAYAAGHPGGWLLASFEDTEAPAALVLTASAGSLPAGTYEATVTITSATAGVAARDVPVEFDVSVPRPAIALEPSSLSFTTTQGSADPLTRTVTVGNAGEGSLTQLSASVTYAAGEPADWLVASLSAASAPSTLNLTVQAPSLARGTYNATVLVASPVAANTPRALNVSLSISEALPAIGLGETSRLFTALVGGPDPGVHVISVTNQGGGTLSGLAARVTYAAGQPEDWLTATLDRSTAPATLSLQPRAAGRAAGTYTARVEVSASLASNSPRFIDVTFQITTPPAIALSRSNVAFEATAGGADPTPEVIQISNSGGGTLSGLSRSIMYPTGQPAGWLNATLGSATAPTQLTLTPATGPLPAGTYNATVEVRSSSASNSPRTVQVTFEVKPLTPPLAPSDLVGAASGRNSVDLAWTDNSDNESTFELQRSNFLGLTWTTIATLPADSTQHQDTGLQRNTTYRYRIRACNAAGCSAWSSSDAVRTNN